MKVLLLNPPVDYPKVFGTLKDFYTPIPSLALASIGGLLQEKGFEVVGLDGFIECLTVDQMLDRILVQSPDILGISLLTPSAPLMESLIPKLRRKLPNLLIVMGNIHATTFYKDFLNKKLADVIVFQEGEFTMLELMSAFRDNLDLSEIAGIAFLNSDNKIEKNPPRPYINRSELDELPYQNS